MRIYGILVSNASHYQLKRMVMKNLSFVGVFLCIWILLSAGWPNRVIRGLVMDEHGYPLIGASVLIKGTKKGTTTDINGHFTLEIPEAICTLEFSYLGFEALEQAVLTLDTFVSVRLNGNKNRLEEIVVMGHGISKTPNRKKLKVEDAYMQEPEIIQPPLNMENYTHFQDNIFHQAHSAPLSTFSIDVDAASYSNVRRFLNSGTLPPIDAVRIEEMINYFKYDYEQPSVEHPFAVYTEVAEAPWQKEHRLVMIGLQGKKIPTEKLPPANLVFLIDVSGSMADENKLPLLQSSLSLLVNELREQDKVAIVVYAGAAGLVLPSTSGHEKHQILQTLGQLHAGGSTAGGAGIQLAYAVAKANFQPGGNNRIILATDGDFNVGAASDAEMFRLIEEKRKDGIFLTVLGFGMGNYKDSKLEGLADKGNGNYAYIDNFSEAKKVLVSEFSGTLFTIAKDVKLQVEFNPAQVEAYRLIGYENRVLNHEDFNDDQKDAGEMGAGHTVTALYEIIPAEAKKGRGKIDPLKYQTQMISTKNQEMLTIKIRYKEPQSEVSQLSSTTLSDAGSSLGEATENLRWAASVAVTGMKLRHTPFVKHYTYANILELARGAQGKDEAGYRSEFIRLLELMEQLPVVKR